MRASLALLVGRLSRRLIRSLRHGGGSAVPGLIASFIEPKLLQQAIAQFPMGLIIVSGSAGKSGTTNYLAQILRAQGLVVFTNPSTANISQGLYAAILQSEKGIRFPVADIAVLEIDEAFAAKLSEPLQPRLVVITNVMDEQLDRFYDAGVVVDYLEQLSANSKTSVVNFDDPNLSDIDGIGFGLAKQVAARESAPRYALSDKKSKTGAKVKVTAVDSGAISLKAASGRFTVNISQAGVHVALNAAAALAAAEVVMGVLDIASTKLALEQAPEVFGRDSKLVISGVETRILLVQNPESFRINISLLGVPEQLLVGIGTDVHDPSWLWSVNFAGFPKVNIVTGHHAIPMASRLVSQGRSFDRIETNFEKAIEDFIAFPAPSNGERVLVLTADTFRKIKRKLELGD